MSGHFFYANNGCKKAKAAGYAGPCIECPFAYCLEEDKNTNMTKFERNHKIRSENKNGLTIGALALKYGLSIRTIKRILKEDDGKRET